MTTSPNSIPLYGIILAGGSGTRFWPLSRSQYPKQVLRLLGTDSMLQATIARLLPRIPLERLHVVTNASQEDIIKLELHRKGWKNIHLLLEPQGKNTAAAIGLAAVSLPASQEEVVMAVFPADHHIHDQTGLSKALDKGVKLAKSGYLVTFGIPPTRPATGYGYIKRGEALPEDNGCFKCSNFIEKPDLTRAEEFLAEGNYYWNSGIFLFRQDVILSAFAQYLPELYKGLMLLRENDQPLVLEQIYQKLPNISIDHGIMERSENVAMVPADMGWSDVGTWEAAYELFPRDAQGNVVLGQALDRDSRECFLFAQDRLVATIGLDHLIVVDTPDATLVCPRERAQEVKELVAELDRKNFGEIKQHLTVERPWGHYTVLATGQGYKVKRIVVGLGKRLSLQLHHMRAEHWVVVQGIAQVTIGQERKVVRANESVFIPPQTAHRLENLEAEPLEIIEIQTGSYLEEDDIVRLSDDYWRGTAR